MRSFTRLMRYLRPYKTPVGLSVASNILMVIFSVFSIPALIPFLELLLDQQELVLEAPQQVTGVKDLSDYFYYYLSQVIIDQGKRKALLYMCFGIVVIYFFKNLFRYLSMFFLAPVRNGIVRDLRQQVFESMMALPLSYFSEERKGDLISRMGSDVQEVEFSILNVIEAIVREPLLIIGSVAFMFYLSPTMTMFVFVLLFFTGFIIGGIGKVLKRQSTTVQERLGEILTMVEEGLGGLRVIKAFNAGPFQVEKFRKVNDRYRWLLTRLLWRRDLSSPLSEFLGISTVTLLIWFGYGEVQEGNLTVPVFLAFLYAFFSVISPSKAFSSAYYNIQKGIAAMERIEQVMDADNPITDKTDARPKSTFEDRLELEKVTFSYNIDDRPALKGIDLVIEKGKSVALVGGSGAGKSTLVDLLARFHDVSTGCIMIDGIDIRDCRIADLRRLIGMVTQESILFNDTVLNNIVFGMEGVSREQVEKAARIANAHEFIAKLENGYDTNIGDRGTKLSGGQRQRLTIARAVLRNPPILILDEATSALDSESEKLVQKAIEQVMSNRTSILIAHRLSTIQHVDEIVVMKEGRIIEQGKHEDLLNNRGEYHKLVTLQAF